ncbi:MAG: MerR family transcriptional regulator [Pseudomonadota bacterium]
MVASGTGPQSSAFSYTREETSEPEPTSSAGSQVAPKPAPARTRSGRKSASAFRTISEVSQELDVPQHVLRFWETKFTQLRPMKRGGGRRYYRPEDIQLLREIKTLLHRDCYTIKGVQKLLKERRAGEPIVDLSETAVQTSVSVDAVEAAMGDTNIDPALRQTLSSLLVELRSLRRALSGDGQ